jgi:transposase
MDPMTKTYLGLDVAKAKVDCALLINGKVKSKVVSNNPEGFENLTVWLVKQGVDQVHACCEATGTYSEAVALYLHDQGHLVSVVNPAQIAAYAQSQLSRAKTDNLDARLIARYCERESPAPWTPPPVEERVLLALLRDLQNLQAMQQAESNRLGTAHTVIHERIERHLEFLDREIEKLRKLIEEHIDHHDNLRGRRDLLDSVPGLGEHTIPWLIAYLGDGQRFPGSKCAVAFFGLCPKPHQSGSSVRGRSRIAKTGHADMRHVLYMPAMVAYSRCKAFAPFVQRLKAAGKPPMVIIVALMRKLVAIAHAILKSGKPFNNTMHHA